VLGHVEDAGAMVAHGALATADTDLQERVLCAVTVEAESTNRLLCYCG
jgi:hypothetical protein